MIDVLTNVLPVFLMMGVGFVAKRLKIIGEGADQMLISIVFSITFPCMIFNTIVPNRLTGELIEDTIQVAIGAALYYFFGTVISYSLCRLIYRNDIESAGSAAFTATSLNSGFMGFPIALAIFGTKILYLMVIHNTVLVIYLFCFGSKVVSLGKKRSDGEKGGSIAKLLKSPNFIVTIVSIILFLLQVKIPTFISTTTEYIGNATVPFSMIIVGASLANDKVAELFKDIRVVFTCLINNILLPAVVFAVTLLLPISSGVRTCLVFAAAMPPAVAVMPIVAKEGGPTEVCTRIIALSTIFSVATILIFASILR